MGMVEKEKPPKAERDRQGSPSQRVGQTPGISGVSYGTRNGCRGYFPLDRSTSRQKV